MAEQYIDEQINRSATYSDANWTNTQESDTGWPFPEKGAGPDHFKLGWVRPGWHACESMRPVKGFRIYHDSTDADDECSITAGKYLWNGIVQTYAGATGVSLTISATNYLWINCLTGALGQNTSAWPDAAEIPHIRIATIAVDGSDEWKIDDDRSDFRHEHVFTPHNFGRPQLVKYPIVFDDAELDIASTTAILDILSLPAMGIVYDVIVVVHTMFEGTSTLVLDVGISDAPVSDADAFIDNVDLEAASETVYRNETAHGVELATAGRTAGPYDADAACQIEALFTCTVEDLEDLSAGQADIYVSYGVWNGPYT